MKLLWVFYLHFFRFLCCEKAIFEKLKKKSHVVNEILHARNSLKPRCHSAFCMTIILLRVMNLFNVILNGYVTIIICNLWCPLICEHCYWMNHRFEMIFLKAKVVLRLFIHISWHHFYIFTLSCLLRHLFIFSFLILLHFWLHFWLVWWVFSFSSLLVFCFW